MFARVSPVFVTFAFLLPTVFSNIPSASAADDTFVSRRHAASAQFAKAKEQRAALDAKPGDARTLAEYKQIVASFRRVYLITPHAAEVPDSLLAVAELYEEMGKRFGQHYCQLSVEAYRFLLKEYPTSRYGQDATLRVAQLQRGPLGDAAGAAATYQEFLKIYPFSSHRREVQEALAELALLRPSDGTEPGKKAASEPMRAAASRSLDMWRAPGLETERISAKSGGSVAPGAMPRIKQITTSASADYAKVIVELEGTVEYSSGRIGNPDRIFFDLRAARLTPELGRADIAVAGNLLSSVRVAQNHSGVVRVVLHVNGVQEYGASLEHHPVRLVINLYGEEHRTAPLLGASAPASPTPHAGERTNVVAGPPSEKTSADTLAKQPAGPASKAAMSGSPAGLENEARARLGPSSAATADTERLAENSLGSRSTKARPGVAKASALKPDLLQPVTPARPTRDGEATLTRALGLKISRIVIDAGHGGHDTGTIGPTGLMEKDLCLDIALRLGKIIRQRLPGAEVVYTRSDDTFIPLEERTRVANAAKADLFLSIHANSSRDHAARGVETYYLNLRGSPESMEVAARENATSEQSIHDLEELVKRITRSEKIEESRELAADVQESLAKRILRISKREKDRGVRKAPFVVLIGADMPSILTEISFLSNPADERLLKKPEQRQRVAEGLYQGVISYLQNLNSLTLNVPVNATGRSATLVSVEQSHGQQ